MKRSLYLFVALLPLASAQEATLRLLDTTDLHGHVVPYD